MEGLCQDEDRGGREEVLGVDALESEEEVAVGDEVRIRERRG